MYELVKPDFVWDKDKIHLKKDRDYHDYEFAYKVMYDFSDKLTNNNHSIKAIAFIGWGRIVDIKNNVAYVNVTNTTTFNTIQNIQEQFDAPVYDFPIIKIDKVNKSLYNKENKYVMYTFSVNLELIDISYTNINLIMHSIEIFYNSTEIKSSLKFLKLYRLLRKKRLAEFICHPDNKDFETFFDFL
jgi:LPS sulfotransferase NodH